MSADHTVENDAGCADPYCRGVRCGFTPHTRTATPHGPDFCAECSAANQEWVPWPCPSVTPSAVTQEGAES